MEPGSLLFGRIIVILILAVAIGIIVGMFFLLPLILFHIVQVSKKLGKIMALLEKSQG